LGTSFLNGRKGSTPLQATPAAFNSLAMSLTSPATTTAGIAKPQQNSGTSSVSTYAPASRMISSAQLNDSWLLKTRILAMAIVDHTRGVNVNEKTALRAIFNRNLTDGPCHPDELTRAWHPRRRRDSPASLTASHDDFRQMCTGFGSADSVECPYHVYHVFVDTIYRYTQTAENTETSPPRRGGRWKNLPIPRHWPIPIYQQVFIT